MQHSRALARQDWMSSRTVVLGAGHGASFAECRFSTIAIVLNTAESESMGSTNYSDTFIHVADDCPDTDAERPPTGGKGPTVAALQYELIAEHPYEFTSDDVLFEVHAIRRGIPAQDKQAQRSAFFAKDQACLRSSPLGKRYGWGIHHDAQGRIALVPVGSQEYRSFAADSSLKQLKAMRSKRA